MSYILAIHANYRHLANCH